jgi:hypothetical protein
VTKVPNTEQNLRDLLMQLGIAVLGHLPVAGESPSDISFLDSDQVDAVLVSVFDAAEGDEFELIDLPWPKE